MVAKDIKSSKTSEPKTVKPKKTTYRFVAPLIAIGSYFKGSWKELKLVQWPNRRATWGMTAAVILFTALFVVLIVSLDAIFNQLFNLIIK